MPPLNQPGLSIRKDVTIRRESDFIHTDIFMVTRFGGVVGPTRHEVPPAWRINFGRLQGRPFSLRQGGGRRSKYRGLDPTATIISKAPRIDKFFSAAV